MSAIGKTRRQLYRSARILGDIDALASGSPKRIAGRLWRKAVWRWLGRIGRGMS